MTVFAGLRKHDVCFLLTVRAKMSLDEGFDSSAPFVSQVGLAYVRGCEMEGMLDDTGKVCICGVHVHVQVVYGSLNLVVVSLNSHTM